MLRDYQQKAIDAIFDYFETGGDGNIIVSVAGGGGKSHIISGFIEQTISRWPSERFIVATHVRELVVQDFEKINLLNTGIYCAGLGEKDSNSQVIFASIQSIYKKAHEFGNISIIIVDEVHLVSPNSETMYRKFFDDLKKICPHLKIVGFTATPFRMDSGSIVGPNRLFEKIVYDIGIKQLIDDGYLSPIITAKNEQHVNADSVRKSGGEYVIGDLELFMNKETITNKAIDEVERLCVDRKSWLVFTVGVDHARDVAQALRLRGHSAEVLVGETPKSIRDKRINDYKEGKIKALVSVNVIAVGFDAPNTDALICLRPTRSPGFFVQMVCRLSRLSPGKENGLFLDFTDNIHRFGPIDLITIDAKGNPKTRPYRVCPECGKLIEPLAKGCDCGYSFERECKKCHSLFAKELKQCPGCGHWVEQARRNTDHNTTAANGQIVSGKEPQGFTVEGWTFSRHRKENKPDSLKVTYWDPLSQSRSEWVCLEHGGYPRKKAEQWWWRRCGQMPVPETVTEALQRQDELKCPSEIFLKRDGKYWRVV